MESGAPSVTNLNIPIKWPEDFFLRIQNVTSYFIKVTFVRVKGPERFCIGRVKSSLKNELKSIKKKKNSTPRNVYTLPKCEVWKHIGS